MERRGTLLLVEDEEILRGLVSQFLRNEGFEVAEAGDGGQGVERFHEQGPFDLLLVDLNLPVFSGVEVCRRVKLRCPSQKVMICSAAILREHEEALLRLGVGHFLTKPYHPDQLLAHIRQEIQAEPVTTPGLASRLASGSSDGQPRETGASSPIAGHSLLHPLR